MGEGTSVQLTVTSAQQSLKMVLHPHEMRAWSYLAWNLGFRLGGTWWYLGLWKPPSPAHLVDCGRGFSMGDHTHVYGSDTTKVHSLGGSELNFILRGCVF